MTHYDEYKDLDPLYLAQNMSSFRHACDRKTKRLDSARFGFGAASVVLLVIGIGLYFFFPLLSYLAFGFAALFAIFFIHAQAAFESHLETFAIFIDRIIKVPKKEAPTRRSYSDE